MKYLGIDPGLHGAIAGIGYSEPWLTQTPIFTVKKGKKLKSCYDILHIQGLLVELKPDYVCIESSQAYPDQGSVSNWSTGFGYGMWVGLLSGMRLKFQVVHPRVWQKEFFAGMSGDSKSLSYACASQLFPEYSRFLVGPKGGKVDGCSDALLIAEWGKRKTLGAIKDKK